MTAMQAAEWVKSQSGQDPCDDDELEAAFEALYERKPDAKDREEGLWSHCCAAVPAE